MARFERFVDRVRELVGQERFGRYSERLTQHFEELLLAPEMDDARSLAPRR